MRPHSVVIQKKKKKKKKKNKKKGKQKNIKKYKKTVLHLPHAIFIKASCTNNIQTGEKVCELFVSFQTE